MEHIFKTADILLPSNEVDMKYWPCLACDQFTSEGEYWKKAQDICSGKPSTLHITLPEIYLNDKDVSEKIKQINSNMETYLKDVLTNSINGFIYTKRKFTDFDGELCGIVGAVDLQAYSYEKDALPQIRPSEGTVVERIPPRLAVRKNAKVETPHILMLIDDEDCQIIEPLEEYIKGKELLYSTQLMLDGGSVKGYAITDEKITQSLQNAIANLGKQSVFDAKYPEAKGKTPLTMAVGDGNHSLATAKAHWQEVKKTLSEEQMQNHPARFCLVELVNIHSPAIEIEPIHRVLFGANGEDFKAKFKEWLLKIGAKINSENTNNAQVFEIVGEGEKQSETIAVENAKNALAVGTLEDFLKEYIKTNEVEIDFIHGEQSVYNLAKQGAVGIILPEFKKSDLFKGVVLGGVLPRKTFSMGTAIQKRYYLECRKITL